jgi:hypothetical protein
MQTSVPKRLHRNSGPLFRIVKQSIMAGEADFGPLCGGGTAERGCSFSAPLLDERQIRMVWHLVRWQYPHCHPDYAKTLQNRLNMLELLRGKAL